MLELVASQQQRRFGLDKRDTLPGYCLQCDVRFACHGGCPKDRFISTPYGEPGLNYLCAGYKSFFHHVGPMRFMAEQLRVGEAPAEIMRLYTNEDSKRGRNDSCTCGSGQKWNAVTDHPGETRASTRQERRRRLTSPHDHAWRTRSRALTMGFFDRFRHAPHEHESEAETMVVQIDATSLSRVFSAPMWLRDLGLLAWFLVGVGLLLVGVIVLLGLTSTIVLPVTLGAILATVGGPLVTKLQRRRVPRPAGAAIVLLGILTFGVIIMLLVFGGIYEQSDEIKDSLAEAVDTIEDWANDLGAGGTSDATDGATSGAVDSGTTLLQGLASGIQGLTSFVLFLTFTAFSTFFLLKDGPVVRRWIDHSMGIPIDVATTITTNVIRSLRRYFLGVTVVAVFNGFVVGLGAYILGVPLWGTIAVVTFSLAYIPFIGAFISGAFAVLLTLSSQGTEDALIMLVIVILANGLLQNVVQPIAFGATLDLNPLVILIVTIGFGALFGTIGMILAAPLTSAAVHISRELARAKAAEEAAAGGVPPEPEPAFPAGP